MNMAVERNTQPLPTADGDFAEAARRQLLAGADVARMVARPILAVLPACLMYECDEPARCYPAQDFYSECVGQIVRVAWCDQHTSEYSQERNLQGASKSRADDRPQEDEGEEDNPCADDHRAAASVRPAASCCQRPQAGQLIVAEYRGDVVAYVKFYRLKRKPTTIYSIAVLAAYRRMGVGSRLVAAVSDRPVRLKCLTDNQANQFYAALGFEQVGVEGSKGGNTLNLWQRGLTTTATSS